MPSTTVTPGLSSFLKSLKNTPVESSIEQFISCVRFSLPVCISRILTRLRLLKRRQIRSSRPCAIATTQLLLRVVGQFKGRDVAKLIDRIRHVGQRLVAAQPREMAVGNIVRRVLGLIREVVEDDTTDADTTVTSDVGATQPLHQAPYDSLKRPSLSSSMSTFSPLKHGATQPIDTSLHQSESSADSADLSRRPPLLTSHTSYAAPGAPMVTSLFGLFSRPDTPSPTATPPGYMSPNGKSTLSAQNLASLGGALGKDVKAEVLEGIREILDELDQVDEQIAAYALDHIHSNEIVLTTTSSMTVQKFLLTAAKKRKFTVVHAEAYPNDHDDTRATSTLR